MPYNKKAVLAANTQAIRIILRLEKEQRLATEEERIILGAYQGFGGLKCVLNRTEQPEDIRYWAKSEQELFKPTCALKQLIYREAPDALIAKRYWESIKASVLTSFYTDTRIVSAIATALAETGVEFRSCLDPSSGIGAFADTFAPYARRVDALEKDLLTARIAQALHPLGESKVTVRQAPFESLGELAEADRYDLITSNIPFGDFMVYDRTYSKGKDSIKREATRTIHNYFFIKRLDSLREGGILAFITSQGLLDSPYNEIFRRYLMEQSRLISAIRLPSGMFSEHAGTEVGSDLIVLQKQTGKGITPGEEERFVRTAAVPSGDGFSIAFTHNSLFEGPWEEIRSHTIATERTIGTNPYGKAAWVYQFDGDMDEMADSLRIQLAQDVAQHFDRKLYKTGVATTEEERQAEAEKKLLALRVTVGSSQKEAQKKDKERDDAFNLMPKAIEKSLPQLYSTENELLGDRTAYARYFFPAGAYTAYLLEYDPKERIGFGAVTMGYGWELGNISLDEMEEVRVRGLRIERDLHFSPTKLHQIEELEELVQGHFTKEALQAEERPTEEQDKGQRALPDEEVAPEGVPALTLFRQYEEPERRPDMEAPREMNGQTVYFDDDHHPIMQASHEQEDLLFAPEEYTLWTLEVGRVSAELKANTPKYESSSLKAHTETKAQAPRRRKQPARDTLQGASLFDFTDEPGQGQVVPTTEYREVFDTSPRPFLSAPDSHLRDGSIVVQKGQVGYLSDLKRRPTFHPIDLPIAQLTRLRAYIEIRESYHRLYDYEATNHAEDKEEREKLNRLYDAYVARWGELNKKANTDVIKMDATGLEMLFLERSIDGHFVKADIFDHPTAFSPDELSIASDPLEALGASLNKYGSVELSYMASLLPEMEESDIISALEGRIYYNPEVGGYEVVDKFISGNVIEKADRLDSWLLDYPDREEGKKSLAALMAARPRPIPFADLDFNLGERWIPAAVYGEFASDFFGTKIRVAYHANMDEYTITCDRKNGNIWHKYAVQGEFRRYDGLHLLKHALHNTIPDINKSKEVIDPSSGETKSIKVRDGEKIQQANSKIEEIRQAFVDWLTRRPETFKEQLTDRYNELFNCFVRPSFDGAHQGFPNLDLKRLGIPDLYKSQKDAVWILKTNGGGICDHEVGAGKTLIMCTESREGSLSSSNCALCQHPLTLASGTVKLTPP